MFSCKMCKGTKLCRSFGTFGKFTGRVVDFKFPYFRIQYPDGDEEEVSVSQVGFRNLPTVMVLDLPE